MSWMKIFPSYPPLKRRLLSGAKAKLYTEKLCLVSIWIDATGFWLMGHRRTMLSKPPDANRVPSSENSTAMIRSLWPIRSLQWNEEVTFDSLRWTEKHLAENAPRESAWRLFCPLTATGDPFPSSSPAAASAVLLTDLLATLWSASNCSAGPLKLKYKTTL